MNVTELCHSLSLFLLERIGGTVCIGTNVIDAVLLLFERIGTRKGWVGIGILRHLAFLG